MRHVLALAAFCLSKPAVAQDTPGPVCEELSFAHPVRDDLALPPDLQVPWFYEYDPPPPLVVPEHPTPRNALEVVPGLDASLLPPAP